MPEDNADARERAAVVTKLADYAIGRARRRPRLARMISDEAHRRDHAERLLEILRERVRREEKGREP